MHIMYIYIHVDVYILYKIYMQCNIYTYIFLYCILYIHARIFPKLVVSQVGGAPLSLVIMRYDEKLSQFGNYPFINPEYLPEFCSRL